MTAAGGGKAYVYDTGTLGDSIWSTREIYGMCIMHVESDSVHASWEAGEPSAGISLC